MLSLASMGDVLNGRKLLTEFPAAATAAAADPAPAAEAAAAALPASMMMIQIGLGCTNSIEFRMMHVVNLSED